MAGEKKKYTQEELEEAWLALCEEADREAPTPEKFQQRLAECVRRGLSFNAACHLVGLKHTIGYGWLQRGEGRHPSCPPNQATFNFARAINTARAEYDMSTVEKMQETARAEPKAWKAHAWLYDSAHSPGKFLSELESEKQHAGITIIFNRPEIDENDDGDDIDADDA